MNHIFYPRKDLMLEAMSYLGLMAGDTSLDAVLGRLEGLYAEASDAARLKPRIASMRALADAIARRYAPDAKGLERFFRPFSIGQGNLAQMLILSFYDPAIAQWAEQTENIRKKFAEFALDPASSLHALNIGSLFEDSAGGIKKDSRPLVTQLEDTSLTDGEKWQILRVIHNAAPSLDELTALLQPAARLIEENLSLVEPLLEDFAKRWQAYFDTVSFESFLSENIGIDAGDLEGFTLYIYPSIFECGSIVLNMEAEEKAVYIQIGVCLQEGISIKAMPLQTYLLLEGLKALSDKSKLSILSHIRDKRSYGQALARETGLSTATVSHHMSALINCGFIRLERVDTRIYYQMDKESLRKFLQKLSLYLLSGEGADV